MQRRLDTYYNSFVSYVAANRGLTLTDAETAARGRVWLGEQARKRKLTDENGGYLDTIRYAADKAGLTPDDYEIYAIQESGGLFDLFGEEGLLGRTQAGGMADLSATLLGPDAIKELLWMASLRENPFLYRMPMSRIE